MDVGNYSVPTLGDLDADGDLDFLSGAENGRLRFQRNTAPLVVTLADFGAQAQGATVVVRWTTTVETDNLGFNLWRSTSPHAPSEQLNATLIATQSPQGATYAWVDATAQAGTPYFYWLEAVATDGATTRHGPVSATIETSSAVTLRALAATPAPPTTALRGGLAVLGAALLSAVGWHAGGAGRATAKRSRTVQELGTQKGRRLCASALCFGRSGSGLGELVTQQLNC